MTDSDYANKLVAIVDELYIYQAGPIGGLICDEALEKWKAQYGEIHHGQLPIYINQLLAELPEKQQRAFIDDLKQNETISSFIALEKYLNSL